MAQAAREVLGLAQPLPAVHRGTVEHGGEHGHVGETQKNGSGQGVGKGEGHGLEHLAADAREEKDGREHEQDDNLTEEGGVHHAAGGLAREFVHGCGGDGAAAGLAFRLHVAFQFVHGAFDDDDSSVDDDAEVDGAKTHQVGPDAGEAHEDEGKEQRQGDERGGDDAAAYAAQEQHEHEDHDEGALDEVAGDGRCGAGNEFRAVEEGLDGDALGQRALYVGHALLHVVDDLVAVGALQHHDGSAHSLMTVFREGSVAHLMAIAHVVGHVGHGDGRAAGRGLDNDRFDVVDGFYHALATDEVALMVALNIGATRIGIVFLQCVVEF